NSPVDLEDPTGRLPSNPILGTQVHAVLYADFIVSGPGHLANSRINTILNAYFALKGLPLRSSLPWWLDGWRRPDLIDIVDKEVYEIKPAGSWGDGHTQLRYYIGLLNSYELLATGGLSAGFKAWDEGTAIHYDPTPLNPIFVIGYVVRVQKPFAGVIEYEVVEDNIARTLTVLTFGFYKGVNS